MIRPNRFLTFSAVLSLAGCASPAVQPDAFEAFPISSRDQLYRPERVEPGRLEYAPDRSTFAPVLTEKAAYPTQVQANDAYKRARSISAYDWGAPPSVWLFGCKPGILDAQTARILHTRAPVVHCAVDLIDADGHRIARDVANFAYHQYVWTMLPVDLPRSVVSWRAREKSPDDPWWWVPGRDRYE